MERVKYGLIFRLYGIECTCQTRWQLSISIWFSPMNSYWLLLGSLISLTLYGSLLMNEPKECSTENAIIASPGVTDSWCVDTKGCIALRPKYTVSIWLECLSMNTAHDPPNWAEFY